MEEQRSHGGPKGLQPVKVFIEGHYKKLSRDLPQTVFFCPDCKGHPRRRRGCARCEGFGKLTRDSVQELIGWVVGAAFKTRKNKFHGAGREDVNVRMLGGGRPFVMEIVGPKQHEVDLAAVESEINRRNAGRLEVLGLHWTEKTRVRAVKEGKHAKEYRALVAVHGAYDLTAARRLLGVRTTVVQHTPERVAHRRADLDRDRWIELLSVEPHVPEVPEIPAAPHAPEPADRPAAAAEALSPDIAGEQGPPSVEVEPSALLEVRLRTQHGTYVKEAISGEGGSTRPSLSELLGAPCECRELDVIGILDEEGGVEQNAPARPSSPAAWAANLED
jgi:tRNA pseudouridine synthase 10